MTIGERITKLRKVHGISQAQLAQILDVSRQAVSKWENDLTAPDTIKLIQLADVLNTDVEYLATGNHSTLKSPPQVITNVVEKIVEKPVTVEKIVEVERIVPHIVEKTTVRKVHRTKFLRNPIEFMLVGLICFAVGFVVGLLF